MHVVICKQMLTVASAPYTGQSGTMLTLNSVIKSVQWFRYHNYVKTITPDPSQIWGVKKRNSVKFKKNLPKYSAFLQSRIIQMKLKQTGRDFYFEARDG